MKVAQATTYELPLPANIDAEKTILGAILLEPDAFYNENAIVAKVTDFFLDSHQKIYACMCDILLGEIEGAAHLDIVTLSHELARRGQVESVGGVAYLASLTEGLPRRPQIDEYVKIVRDKALARETIQRCRMAMHRCAQENDPAARIILDLQEQLAHAIDEGVDSALPIGSLTADVEKLIEKSRSVSSDKSHLEMTWGLEELDEITRGCFRGEFSILSAESSGGKTALAAQIALANAREGTPVVMFSLEMSKLQMARRFYPLISPVLTAKHMRDPRLMNAHTHVPAMQAVSQDLARLPIEIDDTTPLRIDKLKGRVKAMRRKWKKQTGSDKMLVILDYLSLVKGMPRLTAQERAEGIVFTLRDLVKEEPNIHILALSQYSQGDKYKRTKAATRSKDSLFWGSIIHHAAQNLFMLRMESHKDKQPNDLLDVEIIVEKQREGAKGVIRTFYDRDHFRFQTPEQMRRK